MKMFVFYCAVCGDTCTNPTPEEMRCMTDAATNNTHNLTTSCSGVDFTAFNKGEVKFKPWDCIACLSGNPVPYLVYMCRIGFGK